MKCTFQRGNQIGARFPGSSIRSRPRAVFVNHLVAKAGEEPLSDLRAERDFFLFRKKGGTANNFLRPFVMMEVFFMPKKEEMIWKRTKFLCRLNMIRRR